MVQLSFNNRSLLHRSVARGSCKHLKDWGRGGDLVVRILAYSCDDPCLNPAEDDSFSVKCCLKRTKK